MTDTRPPGVDETLGQRFGRAEEASGRYRLLEICGQGGFGSVWRAEDRKLGREIAVKRLSERLAGDPESCQRFIQEAKVTARLEHPGVVPVYDLSDASPGGPNYAMKLVRGETLAEAIARFHSRPRDRGARSIELMQLLNSFLAVARTMEFAHARGVIHRDLKPQNIILGEYGETVILDWGLAKDRQAALPEPETAAADPAGADSPWVTQPGTVKGTPAYMAPEQAAGRVDEVDERTDVYALGTVLFELLTGRIPFEGLSSEDVRQRVLDEEPPWPSALHPGISRPLEAICLRAMAKAREARYPSVRALREDIERALADEPVAAYRERLWERLGRWTRRHRAWTLAAGAALAVVCAVSLIAVGVIADSRNREAAARREADVQRDTARKHAAIAEERLQQVLRETYNIELLRIRDLWAASPAQALSLLDDDRRCPPPLRDFAWGLYRRLADRRRWSSASHRGFVSAVAIAPDGRLIASASEDGTVGLVDPRSGQVTRRLQGHAGWVIDVAFVPCGDMVVSAGADKTLRLWSVSGGSLLRTIPAHQDQVNAVCAESGGKRVASGGADGTIKVFDPATGSCLKEWRGHEGEVLDVQFLPGGSSLASAGEDGFVRLWDAESGRTRRQLAGHAGPVQALAPSPDGKWLASAGADAVILLWDVGSGSLAARLLGHAERISALSFSSSGRLLASAGWDKTVRLWEAASGREQATLAGHESSVLAVCFSPDESYLVVGDNRGRISAWQTVPTACGRRWQQDGAVLSLAILPGGDRLVAAGGDPFLVKASGRLRVWDAAHGRIEREMQAEGPTVTSIALDPAGHRLASAGSDRSVRLWDLDTGRELRRLGTHEGYVLSVAFSPDGVRVASAGGDGRVNVWDSRSGQLLHSRDAHRGTAQQVAFHPGGNWLASVGWDKTLVVWDLAAGREVLRLEQLAAASPFVAFSPDGRSLVAAQTETAFRSWEVPSGRFAAEFRGHEARVCAICFAADGKTLASADQKGLIRLWDPVGGQERACLAAHDAAILSLQFAADSSLLASADEKGTIKIWESAGRRPEPARSSKEEFQHGKK